jgi:uncharacterized membrane protein
MDEHRLHWWYGFFFDKRGNYNFPACWAVTFFALLIGLVAFAAGVFELLDYLDPDRKWSGTKTVAIFTPVTLAIMLAIRALPGWIVRSAYEAEQRRHEREMH